MLIATFLLGACESTSTCSFRTRHRLVRWSPVVQPVERRFDQYCAQLTKTSSKALSCMRIVMNILPKTCHAPTVDQVGADPKMSRRTSR